MTTCADLIDATRRYLFAGQRETLNQLLDPITDTSATTITFSHDLVTLTQGCYIAVDLEIMYVWSADPTAKSAVVQRGELGSTAATHSADAVVYVNSKFPAFGIFQEINADLADLSSPENGLYQVTSVEFTYNNAVQGYDLTGATDVIDVLSVAAQIPGPSKDWVPLDEYRLSPLANTTDFPSGFSLTLFQGGSAGLPIRVNYSAPFTPFSALTDDVTTTGLPSTAADLPPLGAAMRLAGVREVQRNFNESQGSTRRATEVPPNAQVAGYTVIQRERARRIRAEAARLGSSWPSRRKGLM